ncbi:MAG: hypothetical protein L3K07_04910 [Thermoplasmata archaeon]|nr:hypothetical protein [Thermoplasmata archaeon]
MGATPPPAPPPAWGQNQPPPNWGPTPPAQGWNPPPGQGQQHNPMQMMHKFETSGTGANVLRLVGFALFVVGALIMVVATTQPGNCYQTTPPTNCGINYLSGAYTGTLVGKVLAVLGAAIFIAGAGFRMHFGLKPSADTKPEEYTYIVADRRFNGWLIIILILVILLLMLQVPAYAMPP